MSLYTRFIGFDSVHLMEFSCRWDNAVHPVPRFRRDAWHTSDTWHAYFAPFHANRLQQTHLKNSYNFCVDSFFAQTTAANLDLNDENTDCHRCIIKEHRRTQSQKYPRRTINWKARTQDSPAVQTAKIRIWCCTHYWEDFTGMNLCSLDEIPCLGQCHTKTPSFLSWLTW